MSVATSWSLVTSVVVIMGSVVNSEESNNVVSVMKVESETLFEESEMEVAVVCSVS